MDRLEVISREREAANLTLAALVSKVYGAFLQMERATYSDGALPRKTKELVAVGIGVPINCESCMQ